MLVACRGGWGDRRADGQVVKKMGRQINEQVWWQRKERTHGRVFWAKASYKGSLHPLHFLGDFMLGAVPSPDSLSFGLSKG